MKERGRDREVQGSKKEVSKKTKGSSEMVITDL